MTKIGGREIGTKELELSGIGKWWMEHISRMSSSEAANRMIAGWAGRHTAQNMAGILSGKKQYFDLMGLRLKETETRMKELFELKEADIQFIKRYGLSKGEHGVKGKPGRAIDELINGYLDHISHWSHIKTQGATAEPFLPLWASSGAPKALTLFYRMAYSATHNIKRNILNPVTRGNVFPLVRYAIAADWAGDKMWQLYAWALGQSNPKEASTDLMDRFLANASKVETLGLFSFLINPYSEGRGISRLWETNDMVFQPAILRTAGAVGKLGAQILAKMGGDAKDSDPLSDEVQTMVKNVVVFMNHASRVADTNRNPNKVRWKVIEKSKDEWYKNSNFSKDDGKQEHSSLTNRTKYQKIIKEAFLNEDWDMAANMYWATWYSIYDNYMINLDKSYYMSPGEAQKRAYQSLDAILDGLSPVDVYDANGNTKGALAYTRRDSYLSWLKENNPNMHKEALLMEKKYQYNRRQFKKLLHKKMPKMKDTYFGQGKVIEDMFWTPPTGTLFGLPIEKGIKYKRSRRSYVRDSRLPDVEYKP